MHSSKDLFSLDGKVSIVTGGGRGLGYGIAQALAGAGSDLVIVSRSRQELERASQEIMEETKREVLPLPLDLSREGGIERLVKTALEEFAEKGGWKLYPGDEKQIQGEAWKLLVMAGPPALESLYAGVALSEKTQRLQPEAVFHEQARIVVAGKAPEAKTDKPVLIVSAGTSDIPVAEEAAVTAEAMGSTVDRLYDVGVAGIHRLFGNMERLERAGVVVVVAGMEGALASIVGGLVALPVVAVPTSVGYGASFGGLSALLTMLNSCAPGVVVVNIDNGFGAGYFAGLLNRSMAE